MRYWLLHACLALLAQTVAAQAPDTARRPATSDVRGVVWDSIARAPLPEAVVQLVSAEGLSTVIRTALSDSVGHFRLVDVPPGRYTLGFLHPLLELLGVEPPLREVMVVGLQAHRADLAIPSASRLRSAICGVQELPDSGGVVTGVVRDARDGAPVGSAEITAAWIEHPDSSYGRSGHDRQLVATTTARGWFAICGLPRSGPVSLTASAAEERAVTPVMHVEMPAEGFVAREIVLVGQVARSSVRAVLDTVRVTAPRIRARQLSGFDERRRIGMGRFITSDEVARRQPVVTSDLLRSTLGLSVERGAGGPTVLRMRTMGESCSPAVYLDGHFMQHLDADDIDAWVRPEEIAGIEIYAGTAVPAQFSQGMSGMGSAGNGWTCGSLVIWTKPQARLSSALSWRSTLARLLGIATLIVAVGTLIGS